MKPCLTQGPAEVTSALLLTVSVLPHGVKVCVEMEAEQ